MTTPFHGIKSNQYRHHSREHYLPFFGLSQNRSPRRSPISRLLRLNMSYQDLSGFFSQNCYAVASLYPYATQCLPTGATCRVGLKEKKCRGTFGVGRVFKDRTRESFHLWFINAERFRDHKYDVFARQDTSSLLPWILCPTSHTSEETHAYTLDALFEKHCKLLPKRLRRADKGEGRKTRQSRERQ